ncbi:hypothetical protein L596_008842 [Steinernema carpocapsae]|uniref:Decapping nuclease n=1 Tax=Steinernema carpocapsae TaxID=34508 RepID=A0A4U5PDN3_STECR|nr:hypothetical protein L596_008842 [Steinernema carpocapsae]
MTSTSTIQESSWATIAKKATSSKPGFANDVRFCSASEGIRQLKRREPIGNPRIQSFFPVTKKKSCSQEYAAGYKKISRYVMTWKFDSYRTGASMDQVKPQVIDTFGVFKDKRFGLDRVKRGTTPMIPVLNHAKISMVQEAKTMEPGAAFDPKTDYNALVPRRMSIFDVLEAHVPSGDFALLRSKAQIFCKSSVLKGIGARLSWKKEFKLNACMVDGALFLEIDGDFVAKHHRMEDNRNSNSRNMNAFVGSQFAKDITYEPRVQGGEFQEFRTVVKTVFPRFSVLSSGEVDAVDAAGTLVEIKSQRGGLGERFWKDVSCKTFLQMFFGGARKCVQGKTIGGEVVDIEELGVEELAEEAACTDRMFPWHKDDVMRFLDDFLRTVYAKLKLTPGVVFDVTKEEGVSGLRIERSKIETRNFFPDRFVRHFRIANLCKSNCFL